MIGKVTQVNLKFARDNAGGLIRVPDLLARIPFTPDELIGVKLHDVLGAEVDFEVVNGSATRIRPVRTLAEGAK